MAYIVMNKRCCDNSKHCWYILNCAKHVFSFDEYNKITYDETKCSGCKKCTSHCPVSGIALTLEEKGVLEERLNVDCTHIHDTIFGTEPIDYPSDVLLYDWERKNYVECLKTIQSSNKIQLIELLDENVVCKIAGVPFAMLEEELAPLLSRFNAEIKHEVIYTDVDTNALTAFLNFFDAQRYIPHLPLLIVYFNGEVKAILGQGKIYMADGTEKIEEMKKELLKQLKG